MDIKPTGLGGPSLDPTANSAEAQKKRFDPASATAASGPASTEGVAEFSRADLQDPTKLEAILNRYLEEFVDSASVRIDIPVSDAGRKAVVEFMAADPLIRARLVSYLEQVLA
jgi:hypothetical protein